MTLKLAHLMNIITSEVELILLSVQLLRLHIVKTRIKHVLRRVLLTHIEGAMVLLIIGNHGMRILKKVGGQVGRIELSGIVLAVHWL